MPMRDFMQATPLAPPRHPFLQNLDVNQALNNLLSREDDDADDAHEDGSGVVGLSIPSGGTYMGEGGAPVWMLCDFLSLFGTLCTCCSRRVAESAGVGIGGRGGGGA